MSKDYRCGDCEYWKEYGFVCTLTNKHAGDLAKKCKKFRLRKPIDKKNKRRNNMSIELQRQYLAEIKEKIDNLDRIINKNGDKVRDELLLNLYRDLEIC